MLEEQHLANGATVNIVYNEFLYNWFYIIFQEDKSLLYNEFLYNWFQIYFNFLSFLDSYGIYNIFANKSCIYIH